jgi:hypothetical protein
MITATSVGIVAYDLLSTERKGYLLGSTSRGIYCKTDSKWLSFISFEKFRGPLTITLHEFDGRLEKIPQGATLEISPGQIRFPQQEVTISTQEVDIWQPSPVSGELLARQNRQLRLVEIGKRGIALNSKAGFAPLLPFLLDLPNSKGLASTNLTPIEAKILKLQREKVNPAAEDLSSFLGYGSGLTPSGDDLILGFLLALNRWGDALNLAGDISLLNQRVVLAAYEKTTTISANLIECAAQGLADERLIDALDWIVSASTLDSPPADGFLSWGRSSGIDVFIGFLLAL